MNSIAIWTPINYKSGLGHFYRMLGLYQNLIKKYSNVFFFTDEDYIKYDDIKIVQHKKDIKEIINYLKSKKVNLLIIDNYKLSENDIRLLDKYFTLFYFDFDFKNYDLNAILNFNPYAKDAYKIKHKSSKYFLGLEHMVFRKEIDSAKNISLKKSKKNIFICFGGGDDTQILRKIIPFLNKKYHYHIVFGKSTPDNYFRYIKKELYRSPLSFDIYKDPANFFDIMKSCDFAIVSCSTIVYELIYLKKDFGCINVVENQIKIKNYLDKKGVFTITNRQLKKISNLLKFKQMKKSKKIFFKSKNSLIKYIEEKV